MQMSRQRRLLAVVTSAALLASMTAATVTTTAAAAKPRCQGQTATIVGTRRADRIVGTPKRDIIVAKGGADKIFGRGGNDLICAGPGNDRVAGQGGADKIISGAGADRLFGGPGPDRLFAGPGPDFVAGQAGNDVLDGGVGVDTCYQGLGNGPVVRCERPAVSLPVVPAPTPAPSADLRVDVYGPPAIINPVSAFYEVTVTNLGPSPTAYTLAHSLEASRDGCSMATDQSGEKPVMAPHEGQIWTYEVTCNIRTVTTTFTARAEPLGGPVDPVPADNADSRYTEWSYLN